MWMFLFIALGGALGAVSRYFVGLMLTSISGAGMQPLATLLVNVAGSGMMGFCYAFLGTGIGMGFALSDPMRGFLMVGFLGALTTFSSFSLDAINLIEKGDVMMGFAYIIGSVLFSFMAFLAVMVLTRNILAS